VVTAGIVVGSVVLLVAAHWAVWALIPPLSPRALATRGQFVSVDGIDTYYERYGSGPAVVLIPPGGSHTTTWRNNIGPLSRAHEVWTVDLPGSGFTDKPQTFPYTHRSYAAFVKSFMKSVGVERAVIVGQSLGGTVALELALDFPRSVAGLVLIDSGGYSRGATFGPANPLIHRLTNEILLSFSSYPLFVRTAFSYLYSNPSHFARDAALVTEICNINRTPNARAAYFWMQQALNFDFALPDPARIKSVCVPTLIVWGREDGVVSPQMATRFQGDIAGSQLVVVDGGGHCVHEEQPDAVNRAIASFLDGLSW
jgi:4,5:9,10-diseco-3-hydroxy-5,9,17-trioxoandrosta-1(10),2-diene-4-oate hydrolase